MLTFSDCMRNTLVGRYPAYVYFREFCQGEESPEVAALYEIIMGHNTTLAEYFQASRNAYSLMSSRCRVSCSISTTKRK